MRNIDITYRVGKENANADALSRCPKGDALVGATTTSVQVAEVQSTDADISDLLQSPPTVSSSGHYADEQEKDPEILEMKVFLSSGRLPDDVQRARKVAAQALFTRRNCVPYRLEEKQPEAMCCSGSHAQRATGRESQWSSRRSFCRGEAVQGSSAPLVVARNVL